MALLFLTDMFAAIARAPLPAGRGGWVPSCCSGTVGVTCRFGGLSHMQTHFSEGNILLVTFSILTECAQSLTLEFIRTKSSSCQPTSLGPQLSTLNEQVL